MGILNENPKQQTHVLVVCTVWPGIWKYVNNIQINKKNDYTNRNPNSLA